MNYASLERRIISGLIDFVLVCFFSYLCIVIFGEKMTDGTYQLSAINVLSIMLLICLYFIILEAATGKTIGKYITKIKVVNEKGEKITLGQSIIRNLIRVIDATFLVGIIIILTSKRSCRLGDMIAKTYVVNG